MRKKELFNQAVLKFQRWTELCLKEFPDLKDEIIRINDTAKRKKRYEVENPIVFNKDLFKIDTSSNPGYILIADNPGMDEQKNINQRYLIGQAGKCARNFFLTKGLVKDFDKEVIVLNKSCIHTHSSLDLKKIGGFKELVENSQYFMADLAVDIHKIFGCKLWIIGCSELKRKGVFEPYLNRIRKRYSEDAKHLKDSVCFYPHFSYGNFHKNINLEKNANLNVSDEEAIENAGKRLIKL
jgi:hypothetical protein